MLSISLPDHSLLFWSVLLITASLFAVLYGSPEVQPPPLWFSILTRPSAFNSHTALSNSHISNSTRNFQTQLNIPNSTHVFQTRLNALNSTHIFQTQLNSRFSNSTRTQLTFFKLDSTQLTSFKLNSTFRTQLAISNSIQ